MSPAVRLPHADTLDALRRELAAEIDRLPRLSAMVDGFLARASDSCAGLDAITADLATEPALEAWVLRQANSGYYKLARPVRDCGEACVVLGLEQVTRLVYAACSQRLLNHDPRPYPGPVRGPWLHGLAVGCAAARLARLLGPRAPVAPEEARVAGLLHDVGKRLVAARWPRRGADGVVTPSREHEVVGFDHALASAAVAGAWRLPPAVVGAIAAHHEPAPDGGAALVAAADRLVNHWGAGPAAYPQPDREPPLEELGALLEAGGADTPLIVRWCEELPPVITGLDEMLRWAQRPEALERDAPAPPPTPATAPSRRHRARDGRRSRRAGRRERRR